MRYLFYIFFFWSCSVLAQSEAELDSLIDINQATQAEKKIQLLFKQITQNEEIEKLAEYLEVYGRIQVAIHDKAYAINRVNKQIEEWNILLKTPEQLKKLWNSVASWYEYLGMIDKSYEAKLVSYDYAQNQSKVSFRELGIMQVNLGGYASNRMDIPTAKRHLKEAQRFLETEPDSESIYLLNNYLGNMAYFASRLDSAEYFYKKSVQALENTEPTPRNSFYRPALVYNNLSGVHFAQGKTSEAIASMNLTIDKLNSYLKEEKDPSINLRTKEFYFQALDNLGGVYKGLGNYGKAQSLLEFSYQEKKSALTGNSKAACLSEILLGQLYFDQAEPEKAKSIILKGLEGLKNMGGYYQNYEADGWFTLARIEDWMGNKVSAENHYRKAHQSYKEIFGDEFDFIYLDFLKYFSEFLAKNNQGLEAISLAIDAYEYVKNNSGKSSLMAFAQELSIGEVHLYLGKYEDAEKWSRKALTTLDRQISGPSNLLDSIQNERFRPEAILLNTKSRFLGDPDPSVDDLKIMITEMEEGLIVLEQRKTFLESEEDLAILITENTNYFSFLEKLYLELYKKSSQEDYLARLLILHESALYQKVRARLDQLDISRFGSMPTSFFVEEKSLKDKLRKVDSQNGGMEEYLSAISDWEQFLQNARKTYPEYYKFRYGSLNYSLKDILEKLPADISVVRYIQIEDEIVALLIPTGERKLQLFELDYPKVKEILNTYQLQWNDKAKTFSNLNILYQGLWEPLVASLKSERVLIIPDGLLFNLSFESLTSKLLTDYSEFITSSLLAKHSLSYHYSTLLFTYPQQDYSYQSNFVAFAPGFFDEMKSEYMSSVKDTLLIDRSYLRLIPQPFTNELVAKLKKTLGGKLFSKRASTLSHFGKEAGKHRILHIGTHAESDNLSPEYSRLIFAKTVQSEENSLFARDIYQMDLKSELAVLIACETGKPNYQPGEGMISLAHAFNYAGSKSLLIGLWKIDEEASSMIAENFYNYIVQGKSKDEALRLAKLDYLSSAQGRTLAPEFWAGLITMGDPNPISLKGVNTLKSLFGLVLFILIAIYIYWKNKKPEFS